jgi:predicted XRE-type DNA-binding protein
VTCIVPDGGYPTQDGYLRVLTKPRKLGGKLKMLHRIEWEKTHGPIPDGFEVNHKCKNRGCSNTNHMELLTKSEHKSKDNALRYKDRAERVFVHHMKNPDLTQKQLADLFGVTQSAVTKIIRRYTNGYN